jgi:hypothetical protein
MSSPTETPRPEELIAVSVMTPAGTFPSDDDYRRATAGDRISSILSAAADKLHLTNTGDWVIISRERSINPAHTFLEEGLFCVVDIEWHKEKGGGGA